MSLNERKAVEHKEFLEEVLSILNKYKHIFPVLIRDYLRLRTGIRKTKVSPTDSFDDFSQDNSSINPKTDIKRIDDTINNDSSLVPTVNRVAGMINADTSLSSTEKNKLLLLLESLLRFIDERRLVIEELNKSRLNVESAVVNVIDRSEMPTPVVLVAVANLADTVEVPVVNSDFDDEDSRITPALKNK